MQQFRYQSLLDRLDHVTTEVRQACTGLDQRALNWRPSPDVWSVAQVLEHVINVNTSYFPLLDALHAGVYRLSWTAKIPFLPRFLGRMILNSVKPENVKKVRTFSIWEPALSEVDAGIMNTFVVQQTELKKRIEASVALFEKRILISSPANPNIVYSLDDAFQIIVTHEERHPGQVKRILELQTKK